MNKNVLWLRLSYWSGAVIDALAALLLTFPGLNAWFLGFGEIDMNAQFRSSNAPAAALMWGWTLLLIWGAQKPVERKGVLGLTIFPVLLLMIGSRFQEVLVYQASLSSHLPLFVLQFSLLALFSYSLWVNRGNLRGEK